MCAADAFIAASRRYDLSSPLPYALCDLLALAFQVGLRMPGTFSKTDKGARSTTRLTGRRCDDPSCKGCLRATSVAFGQSMPDLALAKAEGQAQAADLCLTLGTSMCVFPSCDLPVAGVATHGVYRKGKNPAGHKLILVNLQKTPYDDQCALRIFAKTDEVMRRLLASLELRPLDWHADIGGIQFIESAKFKRSFRNGYPFRSPGDIDWFAGPHRQPAVDLTESVRRLDLDIHRHLGAHAYRKLAAAVEYLAASPADLRAKSAEAVSHALTEGARNPEDARSLALSLGKILRYPALAAPLRRLVDDGGL